MTVSYAGREEVVLQRLRETYEQQGYEFFLQPSGAILPPFLKGNRPDAMALKGNEGVVIEVKFGSNPVKEQRLQALAKIVAGQPGWRLNLHAEQPRPEGRLEIETPTLPQLERLIAESEILAAEDHRSAAFLLAWSALEAVARAKASAQGLVVGRPISPAGTVQSLEMGGFIDERIGRDLRQKAQLRNRVAHGDLTVDVDRGDVDALIRYVRDLVGGDGLPTADTTTPVAA